MWVVGWTAIRIISYCDFVNIMNEIENRFTVPASRSLRMHAESSSSDVIKLHHCAASSSLAFNEYSLHASCVNLTLQLCIHDDSDDCMKSQGCDAGQEFIL